MEQMSRPGTGVACEHGNPRELEAWETPTMKQVDMYRDVFIGRANDFASQRPNGGYWRVGRPLTATDLENHLRGAWTLGTYVRNEQGRCSFAVYDADQEDGLQVLCTLQTSLTHKGIVSYLE